MVIPLPIKTAKEGQGERLGSRLFNKATVSRVVLAPGKFCLNAFIFLGLAVVETESSQEQSKVSKVSPTVSHPNPKGPYY